MNNIPKLLLFLVLGAILCTNCVFAEDAEQAMQRIGAEVSQLNLGFGDYVLGRTLTENQQLLAKKNRIEKSVEGTIKFKEDDIFVIVNNKSYMVLGIYKQYNATPRKDMKKLVGELMLRFNEPTTMAHDKLIYWAYNKQGKISEEAFDVEKQQGDADILATVKLHSTSAILPDPSPEAEPQDEGQFQEDSDIYVMITSNPLSKIFLAQK